MWPVCDLVISRWYFLKNCINLQNVMSCRFWLSSRCQMLKRSDTEHIVRAVRSLREMPCRKHSLCLWRSNQLELRWYTKLTACAAGKLQCHSKSVSLENNVHWFGSVSIANEGLTRQHAGEDQAHNFNEGEDLRLYLFFFSYSTDLPGGDSIAETSAWRDESPALCRKPTPRTA